MSDQSLHNLLLLHDVASFLLLDNCRPRTDHNQNTGTGIAMGCVHAERGPLEHVGHRLNFHGLESGQLEVFGGVVLVLKLHRHIKWRLHLVQGVGECHKHPHHAYHLKADGLRCLYSPQILMSVPTNLSHFTVHFICWHELLFYPCFLSIVSEGVGSGLAAPCFC